MDTSLHIGAHKTATTYIQSRLRRNLAGMAANGVRYVALHEMRKTVTTLFGQTVRARKGGAAEKETALRACLDRLLADAPADGVALRRLVLSDENLIGGPREVVLRKALYPSMKTRLDLLARVLRGHDIDLFFAIRDLGDFSRSMFAEYMLNARVENPDLEDFKAGWLRAAPSWVPVLQSMRDAFPAARIRVWDYADFAALEPALMPAIAGLGTEYRYLPVKPVVRPSLGHDALGELFVAQAQGGDAARRSVLQALRARPDEGRGARPFSIWSDEQRAGFAARHAEDVSRIARMPGITLLQP